MNKLQSIIKGTVAALLCLTAAHTLASETCPPYLDVEVRQLHSDKVTNLCEHYRSDKPLLIVNTASHCGYTRQFEGLEALYQKHKDSGLVVLGFPSNSFKQEEQEEAATATVCYQNYGVTFPMFQHVDVKGEDAHSVFRYLAHQSEEPGWNFNKYLITKDRIEHFGSAVEPTDSNLEQQIILSF